MPVDDETFTVIVVQEAPKALTMICIPYTTAMPGHILQNVGIFKEVNPPLLENKVFSRHCKLKRLRSICFYTPTRAIFNLQSPSPRAIGMRA